jgi:hypothetical protein
MSVNYSQQHKSAKDGVRLPGPPVSTQDDEPAGHCHSGRESAAGTAQDGRADQGTLICAAS